MSLEIFKKNKYMKKNNLFDIAMGWYRSGDSGKKAAALDLFPEEMLIREIEAYRKKYEKERIKLREENLQKMFKRCQKLFHIGDVIQSDDGTDELPNLIISEPRIQKVEYLPYCVEDIWKYENSEKYTIVVDTVRLYMNEPLDRKSNVCLEQLLYYMDKPDGSEYKKKGFIDLKEYAETQIDIKNNGLKRFKEREERKLKELNEIQSEIKCLEEYNPYELTNEKVKEIIKEYC